MKALKDLLDLDSIFTQHSLLRVDEFARELDRRGVPRSTLGGEQLEALHKAQALVPLYRVQKNIRALKFEAKQQGIPLSVALGVASTQFKALREIRDRGYLYDPRAEDFQPWSRYTRVVDGYRVRTSEFLYSRYQLLLVPKIVPFILRMRVHFDRSKTMRFNLRLAESERAEIQYHIADNDSLVVALSALESIYLPRITKKLSLPHGSFAAWEQFDAAFDPRAMLQWLEWEPNQVSIIAERLLNIAKSLDPLADWIDLIRLCRSEKWETLRGDALVAMDYRIAAEILLRFYEDLAKVGAAPTLGPPPRYAPHPLHERLRTNREELDEVLTDFGISPHPSFVIFLEGETEMLIIPRVMVLLGISKRRSFIELHRVGGNTADISRYALHIARPSLGDQVEGGVLYARPPTHFLVIFDYEDAFKDPKQVEQKKNEWIDKIAKAIQQDYQIQVLRDDLERLVDVKTWETGNFELAHFDNAEILSAIDNACRRLGIVPSRMLQGEEIEALRRSSHSQNIQTLWASGQLGHQAKERLSKLKVAEELWLILEQKINNAIAQGNAEDIPVVKVLQHAVELAVKVLRYDVMIRRVDNAEPKGA